MFVFFFVALLCCNYASANAITSEALLSLVDEAKDLMGLRCSAPSDTITPIFLNDYCYGTAIRHGKDLHVLIRGTDFGNFMDDYVNLDMTPTDLPLTRRNTTLKVHTGFLNRAKAFYDILRPLVQNTTGQIYLMGHSQGGATVTLLGLLMDELEPFIITIGSPQVVTGDSKDFYMDKMIRFEISTDPVPLLPGIMGYHHIGYAVRLQKTGRARWLERLYDLFRKKEDTFHTAGAPAMVYEDHFKAVYLREVKRWLGITVAN